MKRDRDPSESLRFLTTLAAGRSVSSVPGDPGLAALAVEHRMQGLVMSALHSHDDAAARDLKSQLASIDGRTWARHRFLASELTSVNSALAARGLGHYLIKGLAIEGRFYDRMGERPCADLDIVLLSPASIGAALEALDDVSRDPRLVQRLVDDGWIQSVDVTLSSGAVVDLHTDPMKLGFQSRFSSSVRRHLNAVTIESAALETLDPTGSLVVALIHLNRNRFRHLSGFADVARILSRSQIDWDIFTQIVQADGLEVLIDGSLHAVLDELNLDEALVDGWLPSNSSGLALRRMIWKAAWKPSTRLTGTAGRFRMGRRSQFLMPALCRGRFVWLVTWIARRLIPPASVLEFNHPSVPGPYLLRLIRGRWNEIRHTRWHRNPVTTLPGQPVDEERARTTE